MASVARACSSAPEPDWSASEWVVIWIGDRCEQSDLARVRTLSAGPVEECEEPNTDGAAPDPFTIGSLRRLLNLYRTPYLVLVHAGLALPEYWDRRLVLACQQNPPVAAVSPLNNANPLMAVDPSASVDQVAVIDRRAYALGNRCNYQMPVFWPDCVCFSRAALDAIGEQLTTALADSKDWAWLCATLNTAGYATAVCDHVYVHDARAPASDEPLPPGSDAYLIDRVHPLNALRYHLRDARSQGLDCADALPPRPVQLHVVHSWGGGLGRWVNDYIAADGSRHNLVLRSIGIPGVFGERLDLCTHYHSHEPLRSWVLTYPIRATALANLQYAAILQSIIEEFTIQGIIVSSLIGHSLDVLRTDLPTIQLLHDYHPFCPALNVWFGQTCRDCTPSRLSECFERNPTNSYFTTSSAKEWLPLRDAYLSLIESGRIRLTVPSPSVQTNLHTLAPRIPVASFTVIPHGIVWHTAQACAENPEEPRPLRIVMLGRLTPQKGRALLESLLPTINQLGEIHLLGCGETGQTFAAHPGVTVTAHYQIDELPELLRTISPDLGLLLSIVPETFSYTLSELQAAHIPVLATALGSYRDRIEEGLTGFLSPPEPDQLRQRLLELNDDRDLLGAVRRNLRALPTRGLGEMVVDYHRLLPIDPYSREAYLGARQAYQRQALDARALPVSVRGDLTYRQALAGFFHYTQRKIEASPRIGHWRKSLLLRLTRILSRVLTGQRAV